MDGGKAVGGLVTTEIEKLGYSSLKMSSRLPVSEESSLSQRINQSG